MKRTLRITVLVENTSGDRGLLGEHGLGFWVEIGSKRVLFDTGQGMTLEHNAQALGIPLASADSIVLSHGHYDHTGGLGKAIAAAPHAGVFAHPEAFNEKYARSSDGSPRYLGTPALDEDVIRKQTGLVVHTNRTTEICDGMFVTGEIPRITDFEDTGGPFFLDEKLTEPDPLVDDQAAFVETSVGTVVILGCAHAGVINTLRHVHALTNHRPIHTVIGGMHLRNASPERLDKTVSELRCFDIQRLMPGHCTGFNVIERLRSEFPDRCANCHVGTTVAFDI
jgi:7,8-dihydropterin-6-yl-methyl-4-(beta-D-ribofuranosyl)aminobenzene 5'-phosphate synthase